MSDANIHSGSPCKSETFASANEPFWTDLRIAALIRLRAEGLPTAEIGARMGITKNAVIGKLRRLGLYVPRSGAPTKPRHAPRAFVSIAWTDDRIAELRKLWAEGKSSSLIGAALGISKNATLGKARRIGLQPRLEIVEQARVKKPAPAPKVTLPRLKCLQAERPKPPQPLVCRGRVQPCSYIVSGYGRRSVFCDAPSLPGRSECLHHHTICRRPVPDNGRIGVARAA